MSISVDGENASDIVQYTFTIKALKKSGIEGTTCGTYKQWSFVQCKNNEMTTWSGKWTKQKIIMLN